VVKQKPPGMKPSQLEFVEDRKSASAWVIRGMAARERGEACLAQSCAHAALHEDPQCPQAEELLGDLELDKGRRIDALAHYEKGLLLSPQVKSIVLKYHNTILALNEFGRAETSLQGACERCPRDRRLRFLLIDILLRQAKVESAMVEIESAMADFGVDEGILAAALSVRAKLGPYSRKKKPAVSLCMIIKDEAEHLPRCLHNAKPVVDEIVVVDTGSRDRSADIAQAFGARVFHQPWQNDFSKARNYSLSKATGDWIFVLDGDEVIAPQDYALFQEIVGQDKGQLSAYSIQTRNYSFRINTVGWKTNIGEYREQEAGAGWFPSEKVRLFPNNSGVRFSYSIHEVVEPSLKTSSIPIRKCGLQVHHYGKLKEDLTQHKTKAYSDIERQKLRESAHEPATLRELAIQAAHLGQHAESVDLWHQFLSCRPDSAEAHVNLSAAFLQLGRYDDAVRSGEVALRCAPLMKEAHFNLAMAALHRGDALRAVAVLEPLLVRERDYLHARFLLSAAYACVADPEKCLDTLQPMRATALGPVLPVSFLELAQKLFAAGQKECSRRLLKTAVRGGFGNSELSIWAKNSFGEANFLRASP
jgi:glycosyltransferase involved in cell wall biosynthesis